MAFQDQRAATGAAAGAAPRTIAEIEAELGAIDDATLHNDNEQISAGAAGAAGTQGNAADEQTAQEEAATLAAGAKGWVPKNLYKGDPSKWVDAKTFLERGERFTVNLQREIADLRDKLTSFEGTKAAFIKFHEETVAKKEQEIKSTITALRIQRSEASRDGEHELAIELEDQIDLLKEQQKELKAPVGQKATAADGEAPAAAGTNAQKLVMDEWVDDGNKWFTEDSQLRDYAIEIGDLLIKNGETLRGRKFLDKVKEQVAADFPRKFKAMAAAQGSGAPIVEGAGGANVSGGSGKTVRDLPQEDREVMRSLIKDGWTTEAKFLASYFSNNNKG